MHNNVIITLPSECAAAYCFFAMSMCAPNIISERIIGLNQNSVIYHYVTGSRRITCRYNGFGGLGLCTIAYFQAVLRMGKNFIPSQSRMPFISV